LSDFLVEFPNLITNVAQNELRDWVGFGCIQILR
jgi:hypothetical protein